MKDYVVAIPSYNRADTISDKTLYVLNSKRINPKNIFIFVANKEQEKEYLSKVNKSLYNKIIVGVIGLRDQRNYITKYYPEGQPIVELDDDVEEMYQISASGKDKENNKPHIITDLDTFFKDAFKKCREHGAHLWGIYPVNNPFFMSKKITHDLRFVVGPVWGKINRKNPKLKLELNEKEDVERTLHNYDMDKAVIRYNDITMKTQYYKTEGGMQSEKKNRQKEALKSAKYLIKKYPKYTRLYLGKKSEHPEVKLNDTEDGESRSKMVINTKKYYTKPATNKVKRETKKVSNNTDSKTRKKSTKSKKLNKSKKSNKKIFGLF